MRWSVYVWVSLTDTFHLFSFFSRQWAGYRSCPRELGAFPMSHDSSHTAMGGGTIIGIGHGVSHSFLLHAVLTLWKIMKICHRAKIQRASKSQQRWRHVGFWMKHERLSKFVCLWSRASKTSEEPKSTRRVVPSQALRNPKSHCPGKRVSASWRCDCTNCTICIASFSLCIALIVALLPFGSSA